MWQFYRKTLVENYYMTKTFFEEAWLWNCFFNNIYDCSLFMVKIWEKNNYRKVLVMCKWNRKNFRWELLYEQMCVWVLTLWKRFDFEAILLMIIGLWYNLRKTNWINKNYIRKFWMCTNCMGKTNFDNNCVRENWDAFVCDDFVTDTWLWINIVV